MSVKKTYLPGKPRNKKLFNSGSGSINITGGSVQSSGGVVEGHTHENKIILDAIRQIHLQILSRLGIDDDGGLVVELSNIIREMDETTPTDEHIFSALRVIKEIEKLGNKFLRKDVPDTAAGLIKLSKGAEFGAFVSGMQTGKGGRIDERGNGEMESLILRSLLEVPEIRYNRLTLVGDEICIGSGGIILETTPTLDPDVFHLKMKLEDGELIPFLKDDILKGIFNQKPTQVGGMKGFYTSWMRVDSIDHESGSMTVTMAADEAVPAGRNYPPCNFMNLAKRGNFTKKERQSSIYLDAKTGKIMMLDGVDNYMAGVVGFQLGKPSGLEDVIDFSKFPVNPDQGYLYARGLLVQDLFRVDYKGKPIKEIRDRGVWSASVAQGEEPYRCTETLQDDVWLGVNKYRCIVDKTTHKPEQGSPYWLALVDTQGAIDGAGGHVGGKNLLREYDIRFRFKYWGGTGEFIEVDINALDMYKLFILSDSEYILEDEFGKEFEIVI